MLFGHADKLKIFRDLIDRGELGQAYLFFGVKGIGKAFFASVLARYIETGSFESEEPLIDSMLLRPDEKGKIGIDAVRDLKGFLWQTPLRSNRRLVIVEEAEVITPEAQSALLKIVEEPPKHGIIIFVAPDSQVLLPPLLSRLTKIYFSRLKTEEVEKILRENYKLSPAQSKSLAAESFGRIGRAMAMMRRDKGEDEELIGELEKKIVNLWFKDKLKYSGILAWLLERESLLKRFNLNENIQKKAIQYKLNHE